MKLLILKSFFIVFLLSSLLSACSSSDSSGGKDDLSTKAKLGEKLFSDVNLSLNRTQSCASCHNPDHAFIDDRTDNHASLNASCSQASSETVCPSAVSKGDDGSSLGDRNSPTAAYASLSPAFHSGTRNRHSRKTGVTNYTGFLGGQFHDGRATNLKGQAEGPPLNPVEMNMPDKASVVARLQENDSYVAAFKALYGDTVFDNADDAYSAMADSIAEFEKTETFASFDSDYDRYVRGEYPEYSLTKAGVGRDLFFSQFANCAICHQLNANLLSTTETFTGYEYHNIGVPENLAARAVNGKATDFVDNGLFDNAAVTANSDKGKFKVPTLRNVAVTEPYMHNGVFRDLKTVVLFYDHFNNPVVRANNPETGEPWYGDSDEAATEFPATVNHAELAANKFTDAEVEQLVCFMRSLTDARYKHLIREKGISCN